MVRSSVLIACTLLACGSHNDAEPPREPRVEATSVDLLRGVAADLAVSSVHPDRPVENLADASLDTAWCSRTGELAGAWIDVRLPTSATVESIALTAGFTHRRSETDHFMSNYRITSIRVLRDGAELGRFPLDPSSRERQTFPVSGPGGVYRIEVLAVRPGTRASAREVCVSDLRVIGRAPGAREGAHSPRTAVGRLPDAR